MSLPNSSIQIYLLGRFEIVREGQVLRAADWPRRKAAALLKYLALQKRLLKDQALELFWPDSDLNSGANNLYRTLHELRQTLNKSLGENSADQIFQFQDGVLSLDESIGVDALGFEHLCSELPKSQSERIASLGQAIALYQGDLLPDDLYAEWTITLREALRRQYREASLALADLYRDARQYDRMFPLLSPLLAQDPADEPAHRELMRAYALTNRRHDALRQYQICVQVLASKLDLAPEPETSALYTQILNGQLLSSPSNQPAVRAQSSSASVGLQPSPFLVGRKAEFETLRFWLESAQQGRGQTILIAGDTGVGKTLLAGEILCGAMGAGMKILLGAAHEQEGQLPYQPFVEAFDRFLAGQGRPASENPILYFKNSSGDMEQNQQALFSATARFLTDLAVEAPVLLLVDDLHAAEEASLHLFHYLVRHTHEFPVVLFATYRTDAASLVTAPFGSLLNALYRERLSETVNLHPLSKKASARIVDHMLGRAAAPALVEALHEIAEGNPFFIQEITRSLLKSDRLEEREDGWILKPEADLRAPTDLEGLLRERVTRLGAAVESVLTSAAVLGREFDFELLHLLTGLPDGDLLDALDAALAAHLLEETDVGYRFHHGLIRRALYNSLSRARRARLHSRAGEAIEASFALRPNGLTPYIEDLAYHFNLSDRRDHALDYLIQAGQKAASLYALEVAVGHFEQALGLMDALVLTDPARRWMILECLGRWNTILANTPRAVEYLERAIALPAADGWVSAPRDRVRLHLLAIKALLTVGNTELAETHLDMALPEINEQTDSPETADFMYSLSQLHWHKGEYQAALDAAQESLRIAEHIDKPEYVAHAFEMLALACHSLGEWQKGLAFEEQRTVLAGTALDVAGAFDVHL
ncbi:MAG TPA: BTAD domain-containing putative transcriptional regulator [Anaerolineales bacterium]|nr:BTAD domain-containing putative transcriptional regulator [Anaerolineales bacterium]